MSRLLEGLSWSQRAEVFDRAAEYHHANGNHRDAEFARVNAATCRLMAIEDGEDALCEV